ncbi:MAG: hypothetical protein U0271_34445 [Polyangiaceae bacterium]
MFGIFLVACGGAQGRGDAEVTVSQTAPSASQSTSPMLGTAFVLWKQGTAGPLKSLLVDASGAIVAERAEPVAVRGRELVAFREEPEPADFCDCERLTTARGEVARPAIVSLETGRAVAYLAESFTGSACESGAGDYERSLTPSALLGSQFFGVLSETGMGCGAAHPFFGSTALRWDVESNAAVTESPSEATLASLRPRVREVILADAAGCVFDAEEVPTLFSFQPVFEPNGTISTQYTFTMGAPYVCGTGPGHYSVAGEVSDPRSPPGPGRVVMSDAVKVLVGRGGIVGVSAPLPASEVEHAAELFRRAPMVTAQ